MSDAPVLSASRRLPTQIWSEAAPLAAAIIKKGRENRVYTAKKGQSNRRVGDMTGG